VTGEWRSGLTSTAAVAAAFNHAVPEAGGWVVAFCTFLFGYTTLIGWSYYGEVCLEYILGPRVIGPYRWIYCGSSCWEPSRRSISSGRGAIS